MANHHDHDHDHDGHDHHDHSSHQAPWVTVLTLIIAFSVAFALMGLKMALAS
jgi:hypothetical protein